MNTVSLHITPSTEYAFSFRGVLMYIKLLKLIKGLVDLTVYGAVMGQSVYITTTSTVLPQIVCTGIYTKSPLNAHILLGRLKSFGIRIDDDLRKQIDDNLNRVYAINKVINIPALNTTQRRLSLRTAIANLYSTCIACNRLKEQQ